MAHLSSLANGIKVATINNGLQAARVGVYSASGSVNESMGHVGKMNLLSNALNATGLVSAKTQKDMTQVNAQDLNAAAALGKIKSALHSDFSATIDSARAASNNQAIALDADFWGMSKEYAYRTAFQGESLGEPVTGNSDVIDGTTPQELATKAAGLAKDGMVIVAIGDVDHEAFVADVEASFGGFKQAYHAGGAQSQLFTGSIFEHRFDSLGFSTCTIMQHGVPEGHKDFFNLKIANEIIGSWDPTVLHGEHSVQNLARRFTRRTNLCSKFSAFYDTFPGNGLFGVTYKVPNDTDAGIEATLRIQNYWSTLSRRATEFQVTRAKNQFLTNYAAAAAANPVDHVGTSILKSGSVQSAANMKQAIGSVTAKTVQRACTEWLYDQDLAVGKVGCTDGLPPAYQMRAYTALQNALY